MVVLDESSEDVDEEIELEEREVISRSKIVESGLAGSATEPLTVSEDVPVSVPSANAILLSWYDNYDEVMNEDLKMVEAEPTPSDSVHPEDHVDHESENPYHEHSEHATQQVSESNPPHVCDPIARAELWC